MFIKALMIVLLFVMTPLACGVLYVTVIRDDNRTIYDIWARGTAVMLAGFSCCYNALTRGAKPEKLYNWNPKYWLALCVALSVTGLCITGYRFFKYIKKKETTESIMIPVVEKHLRPVMILALCMFVLATVLIKPYRDGILVSYIRLCAGEEVTDILIDPIASFYYTANVITGIDASIFLTIIMPIILLLLSVACYDFVAEKLSIPKRERSVFLMLIYGMLIITYMSRDYHLFGIYTNIWEPMTVFVSIFLPLQFGVMICAMDTVNNHETRAGRRLVFWSLIMGGVGYLFRYMDPLIVFSPAVAGAGIGYIGKKLKNVKESVKC